MLCFKHESEALTWLIVTLSIIIDITRFYKFFSTLPLHSIEALMLQGGLQTAVISCSLARFLNAALKSNSYGGASINFVIIAWVLLAIFTNKILHGILNLQILSLLSTPQGENFPKPEKLFHKVILSNELRKNQTIPTAKTSNYKLDHLVLTNQNIKIEEIFGVHLNFEEGDKMKKIYLLFYQKLLDQYPKHPLLRLYVVHQSYKNSEPYAKIIKLMNRSHKSKWSQNDLSYSLLLYDVEKSITATQKGSLDLHIYVRTKIVVEDIKSYMLKQADLQIRVCKTMLSKTPNVGNIHSFAQKISRYKGFINKKIQNLTCGLPEYYASPYLCCAEYHLVTNYSVVDFEKYSQVYAQKYSKVRKFSHEPKLTTENSFQDSNAFLLISTENNGEVLYFTKSLEHLCGSSDAKGSHKMHILALFPTSLQEYYKTVFRQIDQEELTNKINRAYFFHKSGHLIEADFCLKYHPYLNQGLCLNMLIRPVPVVKEDSHFLLLTENGEIEGASKELAKLLNLPNPANAQVNVDAVSEELHMVNHAFYNILQEEFGSKNFSQEFPPRPRSSTRKSSHHTYENAYKIWSAFTSEEEQEIQLVSYKKSPPESYKFYARIETQTYGNIKMNLVRLRSAAAIVVHNSQASPNKTESENFESQEIEDHFHPIFTDYPRQVDTEMPFVTEKTERKLFIEQTGSSTHRCSEKKNKTDTGSQSVLEHFHLEQINPRHIQHNSSHRSTQNIEENKAFIIAIRSKSYPKSFKILCAAFYLVILANFVGQIIMKSVSNHTMTNLQIRKNLLEYAQQRAYKGALVEVNAIGARSQVQGIFTGGSGTVGSVAGVVAALQIRVQDMKAANDMMLNSVYSLDKETQDELFAADIRVNGTFLDNNDEIYQYVNSFQLTEEVTNAVVALDHIPTAYSTIGYNIFDYLAKNLIYDFLYKSSQIYNLLSDIVSKQKESFQNVTMLFFVISPLLLAGIGGLLIFIIWSQSRIEKQNMKAVIKIPSKGVKIIADRLAKFREELINQDSYEEKWHYNQTTQSLQSLSNAEPMTSAYSKEAETKKTQYREFRKRYSGHIARVFLCILVLVVIIIWDMMQTNQAIKVIYNRQNQLEFANYISDRATLLFATLNPLFYTNNTMIVNRKLPNETLLSVLREIKQIQSQVSAKFLEVDGTYNPKVRRLLFENNQECKGFDSSFLIYCQYLVSVGQPVYMMTSLAAYQEGIQGKYQDYLTANKSSLATLSTSALININSVLANFAVITQEAQMIVNITDTSMGDKITEMQNSKDRIIVIFSISLLVVSILIWFYILKAIREVHNDFKKVLQLFPSYFVLSSYLLNKFLQETS